MFVETQHILFTYIYGMHWDVFVVVADVVFDVVVVVLPYKGGGAVGFFYSSTRFVSTPKNGPHASLKYPKIVQTKP